MKLWRWILYKCRARLALVILPPTTLQLITPALPLFSASIVHRFSCNGTPFSCNGTSSSSAFLPPISYIYRRPSALQNRQSSHTAYPVQQQLYSRQAILLSIRVLKNSSLEHGLCRLGQPN